MASSTSTYQAWRRLSGVPGGSRLFSAATMARVPYFASIFPHVVRMEPGLAEVKVPKWFFVYNHLHTVHAIASCNAAEVAMGMLMEATVPPSHRWIPKAMTVEYLAKATTSLVARARLEPPGSCGGPSFASPASSLAEPPGSCGGPSFASPASSLAELPDFTAITDGADLVIPVSVTDKAGVEVVHADITTWVTPVTA